jgi:hypothetical protein
VTSFFRALENKGAKSLKYKATLHTSSWNFSYIQSFAAPTWEKLLYGRVTAALTFIVATFWRVKKYDVYTFCCLKSRNIRARPMQRHLVHPNTFTRDKNWRHKKGLCANMRHSLTQLPDFTFTSSKQINFTANVIKL